MAGLAAEGLQYDKVVGQSADLFTLQVCTCHAVEVKAFRDIKPTTANQCGFCIFCRDL